MTEAIVCAIIAAVMRVVLNGAHQSFGLPEGEMPSGFVCYLSS